MSDPRRQPEHSPDPPRKRLGGIVHTYQKYDPQRFPSPTAEPPDVVSSAFDHLLMYGKQRTFTEAELARAVRLDPSQLSRLGPSIDALLAMLEERRRKLLAKYETDRVRADASGAFYQSAAAVPPPVAHAERYDRAIRYEQIYDLERIWYRIGDPQHGFAKHLLRVMQHLSDKYEIDELAANYEFSGNTRLTIPAVIELKQELEKLDDLIKQLKEAREKAQPAIVDMEALSEFIGSEDLQDLQQLQQQVEDMVRDLAERQGLQRDGEGFQLTPQAYRLFQGKLLDQIFSHLQSSRTGRHQQAVTGDGAVELPQTKQYEFGDSLTQMDIPQSFINALLRTGGTLPVQLRSEDIQIHRTRKTPKCATVVIMDMSGSMRYDGQYINVKRMALALDGLLRREYPGDYLQFIEMYTFAKMCHRSEIVNLLPKPVAITDPIVRFRVDMSNEDVSELRVPPHFTNIQHALQQARQLLAAQNTPNRQVILITDGLPTAHFEKEMLYLLYPPDPQTESATMREAMLCRREGITINLFLIPSWSQSEADIQFAHRMAETTQGRVFFTAGSDLDRYVVWDYVQQKRSIIG